MSDWDMGFIVGFVIAGISGFVATWKLFWFTDEVIQELTVELKRRGEGDE